MKKEHYYIGINGSPIEVSEEQYLCYHRARRRMRYFEHDIKTETPIRDCHGEIIGYVPSKEDSLNRLYEIGVDFADEQEVVEDMVICSLMSAKLHRTLDKLPNGERELIDALFFSNGGEGMTEREYAVISGIPQKTINDRKKRLLEKLKNFFEK